MGIEVTRRALGDRWRTMGWWAGGMAVYVVAISAVWPSLRDSEDLQQAAQDYPLVFKAMFGGEDSFDMSVASGFLQSQFFSVMVPLVLGIFAIGFAAATMAGEEEAGLFDLLLAHPVSRRRAVLEKALAVLLGVTLLGLAVWLVLSIMDAVVDFEIRSAYLLAAVAGVVLLTLVHGAAALLAGSLTGSRAAALAGGGVAFVAGYLLVVIAELVSDVSWLRYLSPYYYGTGTDALSGAWPIGAHALLIILAGGAVFASITAFERRDLDT